MTNDRFQSAPPSRWVRHGLGLLALAFASVSLSTAADEAEKEEASFIAIRAADTDSMTVSASGRATLMLTRAPTTSEGAKLHIVNSDLYSLWTGDLTRSGDAWTVQVNRDAIEALLVANAVQAEFPQAATGGKDLRISILRDNFGGIIDAASPLVGTEPLFLKLPDAPEALAPIEAGADVTRVSSYAMAARRYDEQLAAYELRLQAAKSTAQSLWTDIKTSGRLPNWPDAIITVQVRAFAAIDAKVTAVKAQREQARATAQGIVEGWNSSHSDAEPISLKFR